VLHLLEVDAMKRVAFAGFLLLLLAATAVADDWSKSYDVHGKPELMVRTSDASITITTWDNNKIEAHLYSEGYKIGPDGLRVYESQSGDRVSIEVKFPHQVFFGWHSSRVSLEIKVPKQGSLDLHTGDGQIRVSDFKGDIVTYSGDGSQELQNVEGNLRSRAGDGHLTVRGRFDNLELGTGDGRIEAEVMAGSKVNSSWLMHTGDGRLTVSLPSDLAADLEVRTSDGHIDVDLPIQVSGRIGGHELRGKLNGGGGLLTLRTGDGSIRLRRS